ncbi:hypothetical protein SK128_022224, partial [Halocaridina rubra]
DGVRGVLEGLASRYADEFNTHYQDVFDHLDKLRMEAWAQLVNRVKTPIITSGATGEDHHILHMRPVSPSRSLQHEHYPHTGHEDDEHGDGGGSSSSQPRHHSSSQASSHSSSPDHHHHHPHHQRGYDDQPIYVPGKYN